VTRRKYYIDKRCTNIDGSKNAKEHNGKQVFYNIPKDQSSKFG
jgi:hypothetical protein